MKGIGGGGEEKNTDEVMSITKEISYHSLLASNAHQEVCRKCFQFAEEVCEDGYVPVPARSSHRLSQRKLGSVALADVKQRSLCPILIHPSNTYTMKKKNSERKGLVSCGVWNNCLQNDSLLIRLNACDFFLVTVKLSNHNSCDKQFCMQENCLQRKASCGQNLNSSFNDAEGIQPRVHVYLVILLINLFRVFKCGYISDGREIHTILKEWF